MDSYQQAIAALPDFLAGPLARIGPEITCQIHEVRLRAGCPIWLNLGGSLCPVQRLSNCPPNLKALRPTQAQMEDVLYTLCGGSVHTHQNELANGYLTLPGGHRVGVGGQYLFHPEEGVVLQAVHSLNIRIAREKQMVLPPQLTQLLQEHFIGLRTRQRKNHLAAEHGCFFVRTRKSSLYHRRAPRALAAILILHPSPRGFYCRIAQRTGRSDGIAHPCSPGDPSG